jgi:hypothetical protein
MSVFLNVRSNTLFICICLQRQKLSEELPGKATDTLTKVSLDDSEKQGI